MSVQRACIDERWTDLALLIDTRFFELLLSQSGTLAAALDSAPEQWLHDNPRYLMAREITAGSGAYLRMIDESSLEIFQQWVGSCDRPATRDEITILQSRLDFLVAVGRYSDASALVDRILQTIETAPDTGGFPDILPVLLIRLGTVKLLSGELGAATNCFAAAIRWSRISGAHPALPHAHNHLALAHALDGNFVLARGELHGESASPRSRPGTLRHSYETIAILAAGLIAEGTFDPAGIARALDQLDASTDDGLWWISSHLRARYALHWGDSAAAVAEIENQLITHRVADGTRAYGIQLAHTDLADLYMDAGNYPAAAHVLDSIEPTHSLPVLRAATARLDMLRGHNLRSLNRLADFDALDHGRGARSAALLALRAAAEQNLGDHTRARASLAQAATAIRRTGAVNTVAEAPVEVRQQLASITGIAPETLPDIFTSTPQVTLTTREQQVLDALRECPTVRQIGLLLHISPNTAKTHLNSLYRKLGVHTREHALLVGAASSPHARTESTIEPTTFSSSDSTEESA